MMSMTGFGRAHVSQGGRHICAEIKTVNHRYLDLMIRAPHILASSEEAIRKILKTQLSRGHVEVTLTYGSESAEPAEVSVDMSLAASYAEAAQNIAQATGLPNDLSVAQLVQMDDVLIIEPTESEAAAAADLAAAAVEEALEDVLRARNREGLALWEDIQERIFLLRRLVSVIEEREPLVVQEYSQRLAARLKELMRGRDLPDEQRIAQEVAIFADRCNVTEEVIRVKTHLDKLENAAARKGPHGRTLDFIAQELNREFNTIASKSQDCILTDSVIDAKAEVEKIREQVQNIE